MDRMGNKRCVNCSHYNVCKYKDQEIRSGITIEETLHDCKDYINYNNVSEDDELIVNRYGVNKKIVAHILSDEKMREIGFTDYNKEHWFFIKGIEFPNNKRYIEFDISFSVTIPKDGSDIRIDILDEEFCQPYDYQHMLESKPNFEPCLIVKEQVEQWMKYLQDNGVLSGHKYGEYI